VDVGFGGGVGGDVREAENAGVGACVDDQGR
jgi:hypothetical protein